MEDQTDPPCNNDVNENCNDLYKLKENEENEKSSYRSVINVNLLNNNNVSLSNTLKSDFLNSTLKSPNLVKNNNLKNILEQPKLDNDLVNTDNEPKPLKGILKNSPRKIIEDSSKSSKKISEETAVDEIHSRLIESQSKISELQNSLPTKLNSATIDAIKSNYSPIKNYLRHSTFKTKFELNETEIKNETNNLNDEETDETNEHESEDIESVDDDELPDKLDGYARFIKEFTMSEDKKKKRSNSFRKITKLFGLQKKSEPKPDVKATASTSFEQTPTGHFNRNARERHTFSNFSCKNYSKETRHENYPISAWDTSANATYFKEDEYSLPIDACIRNEPKKERANIVTNQPPTPTTEDYVCMNSNLQTSTKHDYENSYFLEKADVSQDRHVLIEPTKALIPLNTERALPNPYHKNNNVTPESIILEPMYINVNNKKQENFENYNDGTLEQNLNTEIGKQEKVFYDTKISNSPYETIFGSVRPPGRIVTRSLSPEQRLKMDVKSPIINSRKSLSPIQKSFNNECCLKSSPIHDDTEESPKSPIAKLKSNKKGKKINKTETIEEFSHQNLEIPIDYPEINLNNNTSKDSPKKQLYENYPEAKTNQNIHSVNSEIEKLPEFVENPGYYKNSPNVNQSQRISHDRNISLNSSPSQNSNLQLVTKPLPRSECENSAFYQNSPPNLSNTNRSQHIPHLDATNVKNASPNNHQNESKTKQNTNLQPFNQSCSKNEPNKSQILPNFIENSGYYENAPSNLSNTNRSQNITQIDVANDRNIPPNSSNQNPSLQPFNQNCSRNEPNKSEILPNFIENSRYYHNAPPNIPAMNQFELPVSNVSPKDKSSNNLQLKSKQNIDLQPKDQNTSRNESTISEKSPKFISNSGSYQGSPSNIPNLNRSQVDMQTYIQSNSRSESNRSENVGYYQNSHSNLSKTNQLPDTRCQNSSPANRGETKTIQNIIISNSGNETKLPKFMENSRYYQNSPTEVRSQQQLSRVSPLVGIQSRNSSPIMLQNLHISEQQIGSTSRNNQRLSQSSPSRMSPAIISHSSNSSPVNYPRMSLDNCSRQSSVSPQKVPPPNVHSSPQKLLNLQNVEAFYWKKISEMKEKEQMSHMYFQPQNVHPSQMSQFGSNVVDTRQSRRDANIPQNRGRRSLSLPRNIRPEKPNNNMHTSFEEPTRFYPNNPESVYGYHTVQQRPSVNQQSNFNRRIPQRSTISGIRYNSPGDAIYENYIPGVQLRHQAIPVNKSTEQTYAPIFKRGSLQQRSQEDMNIGGSGQKKVSFLSATQSNLQANKANSPPAWPTKNGYVQSPPTRRNNRSESVGSDNVFISETPTRVPTTCDRTQLFFPNNQQDYGRPHQIIPAPIYGQDIYGQAIYGQTVQVPQNIYGETNNPNSIYGKTSSAIYGKTSQPKQVIVRNKVCDIYGQIHESSDNSNQIYGQIKKSGIIYGELKGPANNGQPVNRLQQRALPSPPQNHSQGVPRNSTYSYSNTQMNQLTKSSSQQIPSESESGSEAGEVQRIMKNMDIKNQPIPEEEWNADGKSGRGHSGNDTGGVVSDGELRGSRSGRSARREDPRRHTLSGDQHLYQPGGTPGGILRTMDLESSLPRGYPPPNAMLFDDDPGIMSEVETSSTGFRRGGKQRSSLPVVRTPSKTLERPLGLVFLQYRNETKRALLPNEITSIDTVKALFVRSFPKQLTMEYLDSPLVKIYIHDSSKDMFYELEDLRSHLRDIRDRSVLRLFESTDISGGLPVAGQGISGGVGHFEDQSYFSEPEFDSEYQHQHIHKSKSSAKAAPPYYLASTTSTLPRGGPLLRTYSPAIGGAPPIPADRIKSLPGQPDRMRTDGYMSSPERSTRGQYEDPYYSQFAPRSGSITPVIDEEASDTELLDDSYSLYGAKIPSGGPRAVPAPRSQFPTPAAVPYDTTRIRVEHMERQLANLTGLVQKALTQAPPTPRDFLIPPGRDSFRSGDEFDKNSSSSSTSLPDDSYLRSDTKTPKLGKSGCHKSVSFEKSVSFSDEPPDMNSPKQHSPQHTADTKPPKPAIKSSTLPRTSSQERDRLKPAPPPKPAALAVQYDSSRHLYRDLQLTPEMYNQLRGLQKKAKDLRAEVRNLRRMSQAQAHSVRETIRDTFIKIRTMLLVGGEQAWQAGMDQESVRLSREEDLYKQEMIRLEKDLSDLESTVEELRGNVINRKTRVNMSDVENMALILSKSSKTVADLKVRFPSLQEGLKGMLTSEMEKVVREEKFLKEEPERLESALRRCKKLTGTLVTLKRLASVQEQRLPCPGNPTGDGRLSPSTDETPPVTPTSAQHGKPNSNIPTSRSNVGPGGIGGDSIDSESSQRPENALDALLDELQTFSRPLISAQTPSHVTQQSTTHAPSMGEIGRKGSMDSHALTVSTGSGTGSLRRLHSYPSGSDTDNSPPIQPAPRAANLGVKPPLPERNAELLQALAGRRVPPPPPPRTSSRSPLASPTSPGIPPRNNTPSTLQHIQNVQNMAQNENTTQSQFEAARENLGLGGTLRRNVPGRSSLKERSQTLPRNIGSNLQVHTQQTEIDNNLMMLTASNSSSCESVNSQEGAKKSNRQEQLEMRHQELLKKQKALQEQYARLQQLQRGNNALTVVPPAPDILLKKTGSESNILQKMGLNMMTASPQINTGSLTHLANNNGNLSMVPVSTTNENSTQSNTGASTTSKVYETDIL